MNYYIQGNKEKADQIKAAFEKLGYIKTHPDYKELELPIEFKDGDIIGFNDCTHNDGSYIDWVGIYMHQSNDFINHQHFFHCVATSMNTFRIGGSWRVFTAYPATKEQRDLLFAKMKEAGYEWDADKKELKLLITNGGDFESENCEQKLADKVEPKAHYDIANFKPFDRVLVRQDDSCTWGASFFGRYAGMFMCCNNACFIQCIPYNDDTKHLLGTTDMCDEQYINW